MSSRMVTALCWGMGAVWALWALVRLAGLERGFPLVPLIAYTPYMTLAAVIPLAVTLALRRWAAAALVGAAGILLALVMLPRAIPDGEATEPLGGPTLKVLSANIYRGYSDLGQIVDLVRARDVDLLFIQELTPRSAADLRRLGINRSLPHSVLALDEDADGGGIYSRVPVRRLDSPAGVNNRMPRAGLRLPGFGNVRVVNVHPYPPRPDYMQAWEDGLRSLPVADPERSPWLLVGDFNATLDHSELRKILDHGYRDAADVHGEGLQMTWSARRRIPPPVAIDHVLADERISITDFAVDELRVSDHRPVYAELSLPPGFSR